MTNDKDSAVLLPCPVPWCDSVNVSAKIFEAKRKKHWLQCNDCGFSTPQMTSRAKAENIWSTRQPTQSDALREAAIEECAKALEADAMKCDCAALEERECGCGAWCEWKSITSARAVEIIRALAT